MFVCNFFFFLSDELRRKVAEMFWCVTKWMKQINVELLELFVIRWVHLLFRIDFIQHANNEKEIINQPIQQIESSFILYRVTMLRILFGPHNN